MKSKKNFITILAAVVFLVFVPCINNSQTGKEIQPDLTKEPVKTVVDFLKWYQENYEKISKIQMVNMPTPEDTNSFYCEARIKGEELIEMKRKSYLFNAAVVKTWFLLTALALTFPIYSQDLPQISISRMQLTFGSILSGPTTDTQSFYIANSGGGTLQWSVGDNASWLSVSPTSGTDYGKVFVSVDATGLPAGTYVGGIIISSTNAWNSPQAINVTLAVREGGSPPFGQFNTPAHGSILSGEVKLTGWALDDVGVKFVKIFSGNTYIGRAEFEEYSRPDIEQAFPDYPLNYRAGWIYNLLTDSLSNGVCTLRAKATDKEGNTVTLGSKTITINNPTLTLISPNGGESWEVGTSRSIQWVSTGSVGDVKIEYSTDNGSSWSIVSSSASNTGNYSWTVPTVESTNCLVRISEAGDGSPLDTSDAVFTIYIPDPPEITLSRKQLNFGSIISGPTTGTQSIRIVNTGGGTLLWTAESTTSWCSVSPVSGTGNGAVSVSVDAAGLSAGTYNGTVTVSATDPTTSPETVSITLVVYESGGVPFGIFATPAAGSTVYGSVPVTGWVLDDIGVENVKIYRGEGKNLNYIGEAVFVEGARPDVEQAYPGYPMNYRAGWGYMMLTNFLPNEGNGTFKIHAIAVDSEGHQVTLGTKTILCDNANAVKPFGAIDTPSQGGIAFGSDFINWGWVLTPQPNSIPTDGSTINVYVDGINLGHPTYNIYRPDIANLFPDYANSNGAVGYFYLDTSAFENGVHTIQWTATDSGGNTDGIGSRYFIIQNMESSNPVINQKHSRGSQDSNLPVNKTEPAAIKRGYGNKCKFPVLYPGGKEILCITIKELEPVEIKISNDASRIVGYSLVGNGLQPLPIGSFLDLKSGKFYWSPGPGFRGDYELVFIEKTSTGGTKSKHLKVRISTKF